MLAVQVVQVPQYVVQCIQYSYSSTVTRRYNILSIIVIIRVYCIIIKAYGRWNLLPRAHRCQPTLTW